MGPHASTILRTVYLLPRVLLRQPLTKELVPTFVPRLVPVKWLVSMENTPLTNVNSVASSIIDICSFNFLRGFDFSLFSIILRLQIY